MVPPSDPRKTVLIVDDDAEMRHVLSVLCEVEGFDVVGEAEHGAEALPLALKHQPKIVILDSKMPVLDGAGTAEVLRAVCPTTKIIAFSAALNAKPKWSDNYLNKARISEMVPLLERLIVEPADQGAPLPRL